MRAACARAGEDAQQGGARAPGSKRAAAPNLRRAACGGAACWAQGAGGAPPAIARRRRSPNPPIVISPAPAPARGPSGRGRPGGAGAARPAARSAARRRAPPHAARGARGALPRGPRAAAGRRAGVASGCLRLGVLHLHVAALARRVGVLVLGGGRRRKGRARVRRGRRGGRCASPPQHAGRGRCWGVASVAQAHAPRGPARKPPGPARPGGRTCMSEVHRVRLSRSSCMMSVLSL
jgi:hypothetical protein